MNTELNQIEIKENQIAIVTNSEGLPVGCTKVSKQIQNIINDDFGINCTIESIEHYKNAMQYIVNVIYKSEEDGDNEHFTSYTVTIAAIY